MRCPTLSELPPPPPGKTGWPWTEETSPLPDMMPDGAGWPRISIVTPSYNQGQFIEETIRSVLLQGYPNLEYIIIDGGSTDNSVDIIKKYKQWLSYWSSEKDSGQSEAINKGFAQSKGKIMGWLNSDDLLVNNALYTLGCAYKPGLRWWYGKALQMLPDKTLSSSNRRNRFQINRKDLLHARKIINQVSSFWNRELWEQVGAYVSEWHLAMDYDLWLRFSEHTSATLLDVELGIYRTHESAKTGSESGMIEYLKECDRIRIREYVRKGQGWLVRCILINVWTRLYLSTNYDGWRSWVGRRNIPYV